MSTLEINDNPGFQRVFWRIQRSSWVLGVVVMAGALVGLTGHGGVLSRRHVELAQGLLSFDRTARLHSPTRLDVSLGEPGPEPFVVHISQTYLDHVRIDRIQPEPESIRSGPGGWALHFSGAPAVVRIDATPESTGVVSGAITVTGGTSASFSQRVLP